MKNLNIYHETPKGTDPATLIKVSVTDKRDINSHLYNYDYILRADLEGWGSNSMSLDMSQLQELKQDIKAYNEL